MRCPPERTATTHPAVIEAVVRQLQARGARRITIADSPGGLYTPQILSAAYEATGMAAVAGRTGASLNLSAGSRNVHVAEGALCRDFDVIDPVADADFVVNCCKLKTHCMTTLSCGVKNLFGCVPGLLKPQLHYRFPDGEQFARMLVDLSLLVKPGLTVADAVDAMEGDGPTGGRRRHVGLTAAARYDGLYALDLVLAGLIGLGPDRVPMLAEAVRRGLCPDGVSGVELLGDPLPPVIEDFLMPASKKLQFQREPAGAACKGGRLAGAAPCPASEGAGTGLRRLRQVRRELPGKDDRGDGRQGEDRLRKMHPLLLLPRDVPGQGDRYPVGARLPVFEQGPLKGFPKRGRVCYNRKNGR